MATKYFQINLLILFFLVSLVKSDDWIYFDYQIEKASKTFTNAQKVQPLYVSFDNGDTSRLNYYVKVEIKPTDSNPPPLTCFSTTDQTCKEREQIIKAATESSLIFWVKREEFNREGHEFYIIMTCPADTCSYTVDITTARAVTFGPNFVYSYLVGSYNKEMRFEIKGDETEKYMTLGIDGTLKGRLDIDDVYEEEISYNSGKVVSFYLEGERESNEPIASFTVKGVDVGEYITISSHIVEVLNNEGTVPKGFLLPNGPEITSFLEADRINEECYELDLNSYESDKIFITGRIHTKYAWFYLEDEHRNVIEDADLEILDGQLAFPMKNNKKLYYLCFELPSESTFVQYRMAFTFSITDTTKLNTIYNYYRPQLTGEIYRRLLRKGEIAFFSGSKSDNSAKKYDFSLYQRKGLVNMYFADCRSYPDCHYEKSGFSNLKDPTIMNRMSIYTTDIDKTSPLGVENYVIVAECEEGGNDDDSYCEFETSIFYKDQDITLVEDEEFSKFVVSGEKGKFYADLKSGRQVQRLTFDIMIYSGDVSFNCYGDNGELVSDLKEDVQISYDKYYLSNKIYFHVNLAQTRASKVVVEYVASINSFFTIQYEIGSHNLEKLQEYVLSGESYLVQIDPTSISKRKEVYLSNRFYSHENPFLANFFALNCDFEVIRNEKEITFADGYAQEILDKTTSGYKSENYHYSIKITEADLSNYNHKMCMLYMAGYEIEPSINREIIVGENINQQIIFQNNFKKIRFLYPHANPRKDLTVHFNVIDKEFYNYEIYANKVKMSFGTITRTNTLYLKGNAILNHCNDNTLCAIIVQVEYASSIIQKTNPMIEVTIREILNTPTYLQKGQAKLDYVCGDRFYYLYTDIGKNEIGEITLNFLREFGNIWAKVVRKDKTDAEEEANWRGIYRMPSADWEDSLPYDGYTKKLIVTPDLTNDCIEGCYLLISIQISQIGEYVDDDKFYPFSILTRITPDNRAYTDIPKVVIQVDEFVVGSVEVSTNERIFEFFQIWLPHDSNTVEFDWQSSVAGLYINYGDTRPTTKNAHEKLLPPGKDSVLTLKKEDILAKMKEKKIEIPYTNSLEDVSLVIGVWTDITDSIDTELYSLRVHQPQLPTDDELDITEVKTDQKISCIPKEFESGQFRCLFVVIYDDGDVDMFTPLLAYAMSVNNGAITYIYGNYIERKFYDEYLTSDLKNRIPTFQTCELNSREDGVDYIYTSGLKKGNYMFINVISDKPDPISLMTSMPVFNYIAYDFFEFNPNPTTEQLIGIPGERLRLAFPGTQSVMVNLVTLRGHAEVFWRNDPNNVYVLRGVGDRISLSSGKDLDQLIIRRYATNSLNENKKLSMSEPGFLFYISYHLIDTEKKVSFEEVTYGKSLEIAFKDTDIPIVLYNKIGTQYNDINIAITFKDNEIDKGGEHLESPLQVSAQMVKEKTIYQSKSDEDLSPSIDRAEKGNYDTALKTAQVYLSEERIRAYNIKESDNPSLYIRIEKLGNFADKTFQKFDIEAQISGVNDGVIPVEKVYHYGRLRNNNRQSYYRLRCDKERRVMRVQIAFNSDNLDFCVTNDQTKPRTNVTFTQKEKARGKISVTFNTENKELFYLYIFKKQNAPYEDEHLNNYAFKYINGKDLSELYDYTILETPDIETTEEEEQDSEGNAINVITCKFNRLDIPEGQANITYFFKVVENKTHYYGEEMNTIAVSESPYYTIYERNPTYGTDNKITLTAKGKLSNWCYLNVIAQIQQNNILEYVSYNGIKNIRPVPKGEGGDDSGNGGKGGNGKDDGSDNTTLFIVVGVILLAIAIGLVVTILIFQQRNKNLLNQVKHVSFQQTNSNNNVDPNLLLQKSQQNPQ